LIGLLEEDGTAGYEQSSCVIPGAPHQS
jgi:hypothetical protein